MDGNLSSFKDGRGCSAAPFRWSQGSPPEMGLCEREHPPGSQQPGVVLRREKGGPQWLKPEGSLFGDLGPRMPGVEGSMMIFWLGKG